MKKLGIDRWLKTLGINYPNAKSVLLYTFFVVISTIFWCFITFNQDIQQDISLKVELVGCPDNITFIDDMPSSLNVTLRDRGSAFVKSIISSSPTIVLKFSDYNDATTETFKVNATKMRAAVKAAVSRTASIVSINPDVINIKYTTSAGRRVAVKFDVDISAAPGYVQFGKIIAEEGDSVTIYADNKLLSAIHDVYTYHVDAESLTDTLRRAVNIAPISGVKVVPNTLHLVIPVEQLVVCNDTIDIVPSNVPTGISVIPYPSSVIASYHSPKSQKDIKSGIVAVIDYSEIDKTKADGKVEVIVGESSSIIQDINLMPDSVQYNILDN